MSARYALASLVSGCLWGAIGYAIGGLEGAMPSIVLGGVIASPLIGLVVGALIRPARRWGRGVRILVALGSLYVAAALFGLAAGAYDVLRDVPGGGTRDAAEVVLQTVASTLWGLTFGGWVLLLWPLAIGNHGLLWLQARREEPAP